MKLSLTYAVFLLLCLVLGAVLYNFSTNNARENFWQQRTARLESTVAVMDNYLASLDIYTRQLVTDSTFIRFTNMQGLEEYGFISTAHTVRESLKHRLFSLNSLPIRESHIYLKNLDYIISGSQFTEVWPFYKDYRVFNRDQYENWLRMLQSAQAEERNYNTTAFSGTPYQYTLMRDIDALMPRSIPAVIWFEWDMAALTRLFLPEDYTDQAFLTVRNESGADQLVVYAQQADQALIPDLLAYTPQENSLLGDMHVLTVQSPRNGWTYLLAMPEALCAQTLGNYDLPFALMMALALLGGGLVIALLVRRNMRVIDHLDTRLQKAEGDRALLQEELDAKRRDLCSSYLRRVLSGHVASDQEFDYIMHYLRLQDATRFLVLYCVLYNQQDVIPDPNDMHALLDETLPDFLQTEFPLYYYTTLDRSYVVLAAYGDDPVDPLMDMQRRVLALHDHLMGNYSLWFFAGVGPLCTQASALWESYEQARTAARYTAKQYIFLPYEAMRKDTQSVYYPIEISAKLLHFINTGNKMQVTKLLDLIHRENVVERSLPVNLLNFLLSDLKNTLMKVRFSITAKDEAMQETLSQLDQRLNGHLTFALCENVALTLCGFFTETAEPSDPIPEVKVYLVDHFTDPSVCLSKLSERFHISESYLSHLFKEKTGENFSVYLENLRLNEAARRLQQMSREEGAKGQNVSMLYEELGYNNATTFRRAFKKRYGITPSEMREGAAR